MGVHWLFFGPKKRLSVVCLIFILSELLQKTFKKNEFFNNDQVEDQIRHHKTPELMSLEVDTVLVPISGGGMTSDSAIVVKNVHPDIKVIVEPKGKENATNWTFPILYKLAEDIVMNITDEEMKKTMVLERMKLGIEASAVFRSEELKLIIKTDSFSSMLGFIV